MGNREGNVSNASNELTNLGFESDPDDKVNSINLIKISIQKGIDGGSKSRIHNYYHPKLRRQHLKR